MGHLCCRRRVARSCLFDGEFRTAQSLCRLTAQRRRGGICRNTMTGALTSLRGVAGCVSEDGVMNGMLCVCRRQWLLGAITVTVSLTGSMCTRLLYQRCTDRLHRQ